MMTSKNALPVGQPANVLIQPELNPRQRILVVEDDAAIRRLNTEILTLSGYLVDAAEDGAAAWDALQLNNYDLIVTDNDMPKVTGVELIQKLQAVQRDLPVIMVTGIVPDEQLDRGGSLQTVVVLLKPYSFDELLGSVKSALRAVTEGYGAMVPPPNWQIQPLNNRFRL